MKKIVCDICEADPADYVEMQMPFKVDGTGELRFIKVDLCRDCMARATLLFCDEQGNQKTIEEE